MRRIVIMGAGGRDFHNFNVVYRGDEQTRVMAFTAAQIPGIDDRCYPAALAGGFYPDGIPIRPEAELAQIIAEHEIDDVVFAYSDVAYADVLHKAALVAAAGANFVLLGPDATMLWSTKPVVAVVAARTGCGKSQTSRRVAALLREAGLKVAMVRHPMPYGDLVAMRVQRFATQADIDASNPTIEEREEYEEPVRQGLIMYAGVDYEAILRQAETEADVIVWDGGNNDFSFFRPDLTITVIDPLRPGHELAYYPGEVNLRLADVVVVNKIDSATNDAVAQVIANVHAANPQATIIRAASPVVLAGDEPLVGKRVLVVEDGPTITHGGMPFGAGTVAAHHAGVAEFVDPRPVAVGSIAETYRKYPHIGAVLPAMGYGDAQLADLAATIEAAHCDVVVNGSPFAFANLVHVSVPVRDATYSLREIGSPNLAAVLTPWIDRWRPAT
ncbi:MAG: GTP-binding protein [Actinomycetota bacterium]|nr:GTP-binding protein [Actinomycetota bacterium]